MAVRLSDRGFIPKRSLYFWIRIGFLLLEIILSITVIGTADAVRRQANAISLNGIASTMAWPIAVGSFNLFFSLLSCIPVGLPGADLPVPVLFEALWTTVCFTFHFGVLSAVKNESRDHCIGDKKEQLHALCDGLNIGIVHALILLGVVVVLHHLSVYSRVWLHRSDNVSVCTDMADLTLQPKPRTRRPPLDLELAPVLDIRGPPSVPPKDRPTKARTDDWQWPRTGLFAGETDDFADVPLDAPAHGHPTHADKMGPVTGFDWDRRPAWARAVTVERGRDAPFPAPPLRAVAGLRPPAAVYVGARRESSVPSMGRASWHSHGRAPPARPQNPTPTQASFPRLRAVPSDVSSADRDTVWSETSRPWGRGGRSDASGAERDTVWSQASYVPQAEVPPPLPPINRDPLLPVGAWVPAVREPAVPVRTKKSPSWRRHPAIERAGSNEGFFQPWVKTNSA